MESALDISSHQPKPPYVPFGTFKNFAEIFREDGLPDVIDNSLMTNLSGAVQSMLRSALRSMDFVDGRGAPTARFSDYISGSVELQRNALSQGIKNCYRPVFDHPTSLDKMTQGQFDKVLREEFEFTASTLDKAASFFLASCSEAGIELSTHLKNRKATAKRKSRAKSDAGQEQSGKKIHSDGQGVSAPPPPSPVTPPEKPLPYRLLDLLKEPDFADEHKNAVWQLVQYLMEREKRETRKDS